MNSNRFKHIIFSILLLFAVVITSCRKDDDVTAAMVENNTDTIASTPGSFLAASGKLKINIDDTTYTFDAGKDSIAFVKVDTAGNQYFGVTAINKDHSISFGISGLGIAANKSSTKVAGSQFLFSIINKPRVEYTLSRSAHELELGKLQLKKYNNDAEKVFAKGTFTTFLAKDTVPGSVLYKVTGSFDLKLK
ncbi:MAG: hypothetical protein EOP47_19170 [Sphingobacteriaceae bacterium]|nr:MAG: hypothetical protein EOP47_19170 [Sphingobacteriaceae bacterium]